MAKLLVGRLALALALCLIALCAAADGIYTPKAGPGSNFVGFGEGPNNLGIGTGGGGGGGCAGVIDLSLGCVTIPGIGP
jgi:hypothetical protein